LKDVQAKDLMNESFILLTAKWEKLTDKVIRGTMKEM